MLPIAPPLPFERCSLPIEAVFFDMGYTLAWLYPSADAFSRDALRSIGVSVTPRELQLAEARVDAEMSEASTRTGSDYTSDQRWQETRDGRLLELLGAREPEQKAAYSAVRRVLVQDPERFRLYADAVPVLSTLRAAGYRLGVISNWGWNLPDLCLDLGLAPFLDAVVCSSRVGSAKPHATVFSAALRELGLPPNRALHVGDSYESDVLGATGAGMAAVLLQRDGNASRSSVSTIRSLHDLATLLRNIQ